LLRIGNTKKCEEGQHAKSAGTMQAVLTNHVVMAALSTCIISANRPLKSALGNRLTLEILEVATEILTEEAGSQVNPTNAASVSVTWHRKNSQTRFSST
jgi:hypothetical protein